MRLMTTAGTYAETEERIVLAAAGAIHASHRKVCAGLTKLSVAGDVASRVMAMPASTFMNALPLGGELNACRSLGDEFAGCAWDGYAGTRATGVRQASASLLRPVIDSSRFLNLVLNPQVVIL